MENWFVQILRFTVFVPSSHPPLEEIWRLISPESPEIDESRPREGFRRLATTSDDVLLDLQSSPGRIDLLESPQLGPGVSPVIHLGDAGPRIEAFARKVDALIPQFAFDISRLAFGVVLLRSASSRIEAYRILQEHLPVTLDPENSRDFMYQINRPSHITLGDEEFELNRLSKWSAALFQHFSLHASDRGGGQPISVPPVVAENFVRLEIDNSSPANRTQPIAPGHLPIIFHELLSLAYLSSKGNLK